MKKLLVSGIAIFSFLFIAETPLPVDSTSTVFGLLYVRNDKIHNKTTLELYPVCKYSNGKYEEASIAPESTESHPEFVLCNTKDFKVFRKGTEIGNFSVSKIEVGGYYCSGIFVGSGSSTIPDSVLKIRPSDNFTESSGFNEGVDFSYQMKRFVAINSNSKTIKTQNHSKPFNIKLSSNQHEQLMNIARKVYQENKVDSQFLGHIEIKTSTSYDLQGNGTIEQLLITTVRVPDDTILTEGDSTIIDSSTATAVIWATINKNEVTPILHEFDKERSDSWGEGFELVDVLDIDGDSVPEIILEGQGYEYNFCLIYKYANGKFELVFSGAGYGC